MGKGVKKNKKKESEDVTDFVAYCCGKPMLKERKGSHILFRCANAGHGRAFIMAVDPKEQSYCSCDWRHSPMQMRDFGDFRLLGGCQYCSARYSVFKEGANLTFEVQGSDHKEVQEVTAKGIASIWDHWGGPFPEVEASEIFSKESLAEMIKSIRPDITVGVKVTKSHHISMDKNITESTVQKGKPRRTSILLSLIIGIIASAIATILLEYFGVIDLIKSIP